MTRPEGKNPHGAQQQTAATSRVTPSLISVIQFLVVSLCFQKTQVCRARIFHVSAITAARPLPGPIFSLLQLLSTSAAHLKFSSISLTLRSSWRIYRASWTVYKCQSVFLIPLQNDLVLLLKNTLETIRHVPPLPAGRETSTGHWGQAQRLCWSLIWRHKINKIFSIPSGNRKNTRQQKGSVAL